MIFHCPSCQQDRQGEVLEERRFPSWSGFLLRCPDCGMGRLEPLPSPEAIASFYEDPYHAEQLPTEERTGSLSRRIKVGVARLAAHGRRQGIDPLRRLETGAVSALEYLGARSVPLTTAYPMSLPRSAAILDYGCGGGWWLHTLLRRGFTNLWGFDFPTQALAELEKAGIRTLREGKPLPESTFDCIRLEHVFEHLPDPAGSLRQLRAALRPGGAIVLLLPNFDAWSSRRAGASWGGRVLPHHLSQFNERSLRNVAAQARMQVEEVQFLPIWELARPLILTGRCWRSDAAWAQRVAKRIYYPWARLRRTGDFLAMRLTALR